MRKFKSNQKQLKILYTKDILTPKPFQQIDFGEYTYGKPIILAANWPCKISIGKFCSIGDGVT